MKRRILEHLALFVVAAAWLLSLGFQGASVAELAVLNTTREFANGAFGLIGPHPLANLVEAATIRVLPVSNLVASWMGAVLLAAISITGVYAATLNATGRKASAIAASVLAATCIDAAWVATGLTPAATGMVFGMLVVWIPTLKNPHIRYVALALAGGAAILGLLPAVLVFAALWLFELSRWTRGPAEAGTTPKLALPLSYFVVPLIVIATPFILHPGLWELPVESMKTWLGDTLSWSPAHFGINGEVYTDARPPLWLGLWAMMTETSTVIIPLAAVGIASNVLRRELSFAWGLALVLMLVAPWLMRGMHWGVIPWNAIWMPVLATCSGVGLDILLSKAREESASIHQVIAVGFTAIILVSPALETLSARHAPGCFRNAILGTSGALRRDDPLCRDARLPVDVLRSLGPAETGHFTPLVEEYRRAGFIEGIGDGRLMFAPSRYDLPLYDQTSPSTARWSQDGAPIFWLSTP